ncbi:MAG: peptide chain release factor N(5)-glutamine methyltransferase [Planctomycetota bacterium]|nr:MAG: peptide chain release factor N(5)-glutamine methyltransferase [Planctomycetota bacterium]
MRPGSLDRRLGRLLEAAARLLASAGLDDPKGEAERLWEGVSGVPRSRILAGLAPLPKVEQEIEFESRLRRRLQGEPLAYVEGEQEFYGLKFSVGPEVLIPRADSECLIDAALTHASQPVRRILDLGTGSGCLLLTLLKQWPEASGLGIDRSLPALNIAAGNAERLQLPSKVQWLCSDWLDACAAAVFDLVISNPPYVLPGESLGPEVEGYEPALALFTPENDPMAPYRTLLTEVPRCLRPGGLLCLEVGAGRADQVAALARSLGWILVEIRSDLGGIPRAVVLTFGAD